MLALVERDVPCRSFTGCSPLRRMVADLADLNVDAASQVAHAISACTQRRLSSIIDTAVDDEQEEAETGAGEDRDPL